MNLTLIVLLNVITQIVCQKTLREAAKGTGLYVGTAVNYDYMAKDEEYKKRAASEFDLITAGNACKMYHIAKDWDKFNYTDCQTMVDFAKANDQQIRGHVLIWANLPKHNAKFVNNETDMVKLEKFMVDYITKTVKQFGNDVFAWDVVNEAVDPNSKEFPPLRHTNVFSNITDFMCKAFKAAHAANPKIQLFYNDFNIITQKSKSDAVYRTVKDLVKRGCPIHGVGFQSHISIDFADDQYKIFTNDLKRYEDLGLIVHITELDVACKKPGDCPYSDAYNKSWPAEALQKQADVYKKILTGCLEANNCESFEVWGFTDRRTWLAPGQNPTILDTNMDPKPAYKALLDTLSAAKKNQKYWDSMQDIIQ